MAQLYADRSFLELYLRHVGKSEVPERYHLWCSISLVAALLGSNVWHESIRGQPLRPNLYTALVGPGGIGKDVAINEAMKFLVGRERRTGLFFGKITYAGLLDQLATPAFATKDVLAKASAKIYLVMSELAMDVGEGPLASMFIKHVTGLYSGAPVALSERIRSRDEKTEIKNHVLNCLWGSTERWLIDTVGQDAILGGFFARVIPVQARYDFDNRQHKPDYPPDHAALIVELKNRVERIATLRGEMRYTRKAQEIEDAWIQHRPAPTDERLFATWKRLPALARKLAMTFAASSTPEPSLVIKSHHIAIAQKMADRILKEVPTIMDYASTSSSTVKIETVRALIAEAKTIQWSQLVQRARTRGVSAGEVREAVNALLEGHEIAGDQSNKGGVVLRVNGVRFGGGEGERPSAKEGPDLRVVH